MLDTGHAFNRKCRDSVCICIYVCNYVCVYKVYLHDAIVAILLSFNFEFFWFESEGFKEKERV